MSHSTTTPAGAGNTNTPPAITPNVGKSKVAKYVLLAFVLLILLVTFLIMRYKNRPVATYNNQPIENQQKANDKDLAAGGNWVLDTSIVVNFGPEYGEISYFPTGKGMGFSYATEPYDAINSDGKEVHGEKNEDASIKLPKGNGNTRLKFKSSNGKDGQITVNLFKKI